MRRAFTLIEVLCTVVILSIAAAVLVPQLGNKADLELSAGCRQVLFDLDMARSEAITRNTTLYIAFTPSSGSAGGSFSVYKNVGGSLALLTNPFTKANWTATFGTGTFSRIKLTAANLDSRDILAFGPDGSPLSATGISVADLSSGTITLSGGGKSMSVKVEPGTGALSVQ